MPRARRFGAVAISVLALCGVGLTGRAGAAARQGPAVAVRPFVQGGQTVAVYSYAAAIHESVWIQTPLDSDGDGHRDRVMLDIIRPAEAAAANVKVPVILDASPYFQCCGRGNEAETKTYQPDGTIAKMPLFYDNYFVPRGYAVAALDLTGTGRSAGCADLGGRNEVLGAKAAVDWLNGRASGFDLQGNVVRADWSTGKVGMIGKSWDGSIANGVAATGVSGLRTVVAISSISSWYDYVRFGGVVREPQYVTEINSVVSGRAPEVCRSVLAAEQRASDDRTGNFNAFWQARDYRAQAGRVHAAMFIVHGLNDTNVTTKQFAAWWQALAAHHVARRLWLSQTGHVDPFDYRRAAWVHTLHQWFDHWLQGLANGVMSQPRASIERPSGRWITARDWLATTRTATTPLSRWGGIRVRTLTDRPQLREAAAVADPTRHVAGREAFLGPIRHSTLRIAGTASVTLRLQVNRPTTELTARLIDYGRQRRINYQSTGEGISTAPTQSCWGQSTPSDDACYHDTQQTFTTTAIDVITRGWLDAAHHRSLSQVTPLQPHRWYLITVPLNPTDTIIPVGHRIGIVITLSDPVATSPRTEGATIRIDPTGSTLHLPRS
jgi:X-Pro dipeptidyl-peptidase